DALYGTDVIARDGDLAPGKGYNAARGAAVVDKAATFLDESFPLASDSHRDVTGYHVVKDGETRRHEVDTAAGGTGLRAPAAFVGYGGTEAKGELVLAHHGLHVILVIEPASVIGTTHRAGLSDIIVES